MPNQKVNLGLDLRGGSHLMLEVDFDYYLNEQINNLRSDIRAAFRDESIRTLPVVKGKSVVFVLSDENKIKSVKKIIRKITNKVVIKEDSGKFKVFYSDQQISLMRQNLIKQSIEIIRRRVDENGTREPLIQAQGKDRILLQVPGVKDSAELKSILGKTAKMTFHFVKDNSDASTASVQRSFDSEGNTYVIYTEVILSGDLLIDANPTYHEGQPAVAFRLMT